MNLLAVPGASASNASEEGALQSSMASLVELESHVWESVPEEVQRLILKALPPNVYCQFRCVSKDWYRMLSPPPDWSYWARTKAVCSIVASSNLGPNQCRIGLLWHSNEEKFLNLPIFGTLASKMNLALGRPRHVHWHLADVEEGLFCYYAVHDELPEELQVAVCNPATTVVRLVTPEKSGFAKYPDFVFKLKLVVNREEKTFRIFVVETAPLGSIAVFDSATSTWKLHPGVFPFSDWPDQFFLRENIMYAYSRFTGSNGYFSLSAIDINELDKTEIGNSSATVILTSLDDKITHIQNFVVQDRGETILVRTGPVIDGNPQTEILKLKIDREAFQPSCGFELSVQPDSGKSFVPPTFDRRYLTNVNCVQGYLYLVYRALNQCDPSATARLYRFWEPSMWVNHEIDNTASSEMVDPLGWAAFTRLQRRRPDMLVKHSCNDEEFSVIACRRPSEWTTIEGLFPWTSSVDVDLYLHG